MGSIIDIKRIDADFFEGTLKQSINRSIFKRIADVLDEFYKHVRDNKAGYGPSSLVFEIFSILEFVNEHTINKYVTKLIADNKSVDKSKFKRGQDYHAYFKIVNPSYRVICEVLEFLKGVYNSELEDEIAEIPANPFDENEYTPLDDEDSLGLSDGEIFYIQDVLSIVSQPAPPDANESQTTSDQLDIALKLVCFLDKKIQESEELDKSEFNVRYKEALIDFQFYLNQLLCYTKSES